MNESTHIYTDKNTLADYNALKDASGIPMSKLIKKALPLIAEKLGYMPVGSVYVPITEINKTNNKNQHQNQINP